MRPEQKSKHLLNIARSKAKMVGEYHVPEQYQDIDLTKHPAKLFIISIGLLGDMSAAINNGVFEFNTFAELQNNLIFSAYFFDFYAQSKLNETLDPYLILLGAASYYLCGLPGSASVLAKRINDKNQNLNNGALGDLLLWLLQGDFKIDFVSSEKPFSEYINGIAKWFPLFFKNGDGEEILICLTTKLRTAIYELGTPNQLLLGDIISAIVRKKVENSTWKTLPLYSGLTRDKWLSTLQKESFVRELWPAQHLIGRDEVLKGKSSIIQMPTSAGKTKAVELIIRSAFLANRTTLAVIVAPFRALCHEIKNSFEEAFHNEHIAINELTDVMLIDPEFLELLDKQKISAEPSEDLSEDLSELFFNDSLDKTDFDAAGLLDDRQKILIVTPEKLLYILRHTPKLAHHIGLLIFDEGHQFDSGTRGITYELLLTSLRSILPRGIQKVLISAVISNPEAVGQWLNGDPNVVKGGSLNPTFKSVGFVSWRTTLGKIEYVDSLNPEKMEFFVPRVIDSFNLGKKGKEQNDRFFPKKSKGNEIALYLGLKLVLNGGVAIFCGTIPIVNSICKIAVEIIDRGIPLQLPQEFSDKKEIELLYNLHIENLGPDAKASISAKYGIFAHHGNMPYGIRLSIEHAMRKNLVRFIICTSTLAQGVNLPIRYLIVTGVHQGTEQIKVRDFHNLIGRAGRAGMYTESSILFADPDVYDQRQYKKGLRRWGICKKLLDPTKSEECTSTLLQFIPLKILNDRFKSKDGRSHSLIIDILIFAKAHVEGWISLNELITDIERQHKENGFTAEVMTDKFQKFSNVLSSIEGFLLSNWDITNIRSPEEEIANLAEQTLAYSLADNEKKEGIQSLFKFLAKNISETITNSTRRNAFSKTFYGINDAKAIEEWVHSEVNNLVSVENIDEFLHLVWPLMMVYIRNNTFNKFNQKDLLKIIIQKWASGASFQTLFKIALENKCRINSGKQSREIKIENIVDICEKGCAYEGVLLVSALCEFIMPGKEETGKLISRLQLFQKSLKYGLPTATSITIYELGFSDRVIAQDLVKSLDICLVDKKDVINMFKQKRDISISVITKYPTYFKDKMNAILAGQ